MGRMRRTLLLVASAVLVVGGLTLAVLPFHISINVPEPQGAPADIRARCKSPATGAWNRDQKGQLALWAVTTGGGDSGYEVRSGAAPYCAGPARSRLGASFLALIGAFAPAVLGF